VTNLSPEALRLLHVHAVGGWELVAKHEREAVAAARAEGPRQAILQQIADERRRQIEVEGWTEAHDDQHGNGEIGRAAAYFAAHHAPLTYSDGLHRALADALNYVWPWDQSWRKPKSPRENLIRAGALIVAEIERLERADLRFAPPSPPPSLRAAAEEVLNYMDKIDFGDGSTGRARVQKLLRDALGEAG
jgi:hypothetical protein